MKRTDSFLRDYCLKPLTNLPMMLLGSEGSISKQLTFSPSGPLAPGAPTSPSGPFE